MSENYCFSQWDYKVIFRFSKFLLLVDSSEYYWILSGIKYTLASKLMCSYGDDSIMKTTTNTGFSKVIADTLAFMGVFLAARPSKNMSRQGWCEVPTLTLKKVPVLSA